MRKRSIVVLILGTMFLIPLIGVCANQRSNVAPGTNVATGTRETILERINSQIRERIQTNLQEFERNRLELKALMEQNRIMVQSEIQQERNKLRQKMFEYRNQLNQQLQKIKTEQKRMIVEHIYEMINNLNERITNHYLNVLNHLEDVLERIESRTAKAKLNGLDTTEVEKAIKTAHDAIEEARNSVKSQAEKIYAPPEINKEETLRLDVGKLRQQLHFDLKTTEGLIRDAREKVRIAATTLAQIRGVDKVEISTSTPTTTSEGTTTNETTNSEASP